MNHVQTQAYEDLQLTETKSVELLAITRDILPNWRPILSVTVASGAIGLAIAFIVPPTYTAKTTFISPQQQQNSAAAALASLGALSGLAGMSNVVKSPADQFITLMNSEQVANRLIAQFELMNLYEAKFKSDARRELSKNVRIFAGKKDNLLTVEVDDKDPMRAANLANAYVKELRLLTNSLAMTEAQQRRVFFEKQLLETKKKLDQAQLALQKSGLGQSTIKSEPKVAAESYGRLTAEINATEVKINGLLSRMTPGAYEVRQQQSVLSALKQQLARLERPTGEDGKSENYIEAIREFKYQETLFEIFARQFELAKVDESREAALIQVIDEATPPERKSKPKRAYFALIASAFGFLSACIFFARKYFRK